MTCREVRIVCTKEETWGNVMTTVYHTEDNEGSLKLMIYLSPLDSACYSATLTKNCLQILAGLQLVCADTDQFVIKKKCHC